mgnify:CR=1 FL=1
MKKDIVEFQNQTLLKKHVAAIHCSNTLSLLQRKISNALLFNAYDKLLDQEEHEITKKLLLEVAGYLFEKDGYYHTSLENIASSAWVTRGAIYWNFTGKNDLLEKLLDQNYKKYSMLLELAFDDVTSARE